ncbi:hypothetical protein A5780_31610 [Nocardia sp. 852002-20019_SCH5090214]|uniref:Uncharacterized protein n=2 Tax=Nocardia TaxID=1817 RepID=A0A231GVE5_9NOCA|nr:MULTISPECIES: hypothetical protein [Nocardia]MDN2495340.1 hypothetical protein [Nocardia nova]OBA50075.1 hypothetical protein A5780_31610 [Nocardia sp. 852002-20019_SCH5090214]OXR40600.1 hypothetical protein B7C42_07285 [Nocardia cerradoensis]PPJ10772.1 hypothetical protein C5E51_11010 [Nocardia nova]PPJ17361.1 hypothetical protein C5E44_15975 [Nocardia nova]
MCFGAEIAYLLLWAATTRGAPPAVQMLRRLVAALCVLLIGGFITVLALGGGAGERYSHTG